MSTERKKISITEKLVEPGTDRFYTEKEQAAMLLEKFGDAEKEFQENKAKGITHQPTAAELESEQLMEEELDDLEAEFEPDDRPE